MDASFPITLLRDLPVQSGSVDPHGVHVVAVVDGRYARRVPLDSVQDVFVSHDANVPYSYDSPSHGDMAWDRTGLYVHTDAGWGKTMLYCSNWPDLTPTTRFLRVDDVMSLSGTEVGNALASLGIGDATDAERGLVRLAGSMLDGAAVPTAATVAAYVAGELQGVRDDVAAVGEMRDDVAGMLQDVGSLESSVRSMRDDVVEASSEVHADMARAETAASGATASAQAAREAMEAAEAAADRAEAVVDFDEVATQGSRKAVRSGGLYDEFASVKGSIQNVSDTLGAHTGDSVVHITREERERWNAGGSGGGLTPEQQTVLDRLVGGAVAGEFSVWSATEPPSSATIHSYIGSSGTALDLAADSVSIVSGTGVSVDGGLDVDGSPVLTRAMLGAFPADGVEERDGVATVSDARAYISRSISESAGTVLANYVPLHGDSHITGSLSMSGDSRASTGTFSNGIVVTSATAVSSLAGRIDSDVKIGYGPTGNVKAETLLEVGDPKAAGTLSYNGFTLRIEAGSRSKAHGQLKLVNGYETCTVSIGGVTKSVSPVPLDSSVQAVYSSPAVAAVAASDAATASNDSGGTYASCLFGPVPDPSACSVSTIAVYWHGDGGPGTSGNRIAEFADADTLLDLPGVLASDPVLSSLLSVSPVDPSAGCGTVVQRVSARVCGPLFEGFGISAAGPSNPNLIREVQLSGGSGGQGASRAIGVLAGRVGSAVLLSNGTDSQSAVYIQSQDAVATLYKDGAVLSAVSIPYRSSFPAFVEKLQALVSGTGISVYKVTVVSRAAASSDTVTVQCIVDTPGSDGNGYFINVTAPDGLNLEIKFFAGADADSPTPPGPTPDPPAYGTAYGDIGPSVNGTGDYERGVGIAWYGEGGPEVNPVYLIPATNRPGSMPTIDDFELLDPDHQYASTVFASRLRGSLVSGDLEPSYVARVQSVHKGSVDNGFAAVALDADTAKSLSTQLTGGLETEQEAVPAIGVMCTYNSSAGFSLYSYYVYESTVIVSQGDTISIEDSAGNVLASYSVGSSGLTLNELCDVINSMQGSIAGGPVLEAFVVPCFVKSSEVDEYTIHCRAVNAGAAYNGYVVRSRLNLAEDPLHASSPGVLNILMFAGADAYSPGPGPVPPGPTPEYDPVTPQQIAALVSTIPGYTGTVSSTDSNTVNVEAVQAGSDGNRDMAAYGGLIVQTPLGGGSDDRGVGELATAISSMDGFDVSASVRSPSVIRIVAKASGSGPNGREFTATGCFGTEGAVMGSLVPGADGIPGTSYGLWINGVRVVPGQGGGGEPFDGHLENDLHVGHEGTAFKIYLNGKEFKGEVDLDPVPVPGSTDTAVSSAGVYDATFVRTSGGDTVWAGPGLLAHESDNNIHTTPLAKKNWNDAVNAHLVLKFMPFGSADREAHYFVLAASNTYRGFLKAISIRGASSGTVHSPFYIGVFERPEGGSSDPSTWNLMGVSTEAGQEEIGRSHSWDFDSVELTGGRDIAICAMTRPGQGWNTSTPFNVRVGGRPSGDTSSNVDGAAGLVQCTLSTMVMSGEMIVAHEADTSAHLDSFESELMDNMMAGWLWYPNQSGSVTVTPDAGGAPNGVSMQSTNAYGRVEVQDYGVVITATRTPQWLDASTTSYAFYDILTTKDLDPSSVPALSGRVTAVEAGVGALEANSHDMRTITYADKHGEVQVVAYFGTTASDFLGVCFPNGFTVAGKTWYMMSKNEFDSLAVASGDKRTITSSDGDVVFYEPTATGGNAIFRVDSRYNGVQGGVTPSWTVSVNYGSITVSQPAAYALPTAQEAARVRMLDVASNAADRRMDRLERVVSNLGNGLLALTEDDIYFATPDINNNGAFSLSNGTLAMSGGGGYSMVMLHKAARHFEATTVAGQQFAIMVACKPGDNTGGVGVFISGANNVFVCDKSAHNLTDRNPVTGYTKLSSVPAGKVVVDIVDMSASPQEGTGYTRRVVLSVGGSKVLDTYIDGGLGSKTAYTEPRIGVIGNWSGGGGWTLTDCKVSYGQQPIQASNAE